jgi:hypothetical protein
MRSKTTPAMSHPCTSKRKRLYRTMSARVRSAAAAVVARSDVGRGVGQRPWDRSAANNSASLRRWRAISTPSTCTTGIWWSYICRNVECCGSERSTSRYSSGTCRGARAQPQTGLNRHTRTAGRTGRGAAAVLTIPATLPMINFAPPQRLHGGFVRVKSVTVRRTPPFICARPDTGATSRSRAAHPGCCPSSVAEFPNVTGVRWRRCCRFCTLSLCRGCSSSAH